MIPPRSAPRRSRLRDGASAARRRRDAGVRRGLTLLETVFAIVLLGMIGVSVASMLSLKARLTAADVQRLGAYEVANRIMLMQLDDRINPPSPQMAISQNGYRYRFSVTEEPVRMKVKQTAAAMRSQDQVPLDRFKRITVRVWIAAEGPGNTYDVAGDLLAELTRVYDPFADLFRNPDSRDRLVNTPEGLRIFMSRFSNMDQAQPQQQPAPAPAGSDTRRGR